MHLKMETEFWNFLRVLGFQEVARQPKMKDIVKMFRRTALRKHPDKPGGSTQEFQQLQEAFRKAGQFLEKAKPPKNVGKEEEDAEENAARRLFKEFYINGETHPADFLQLFQDHHSIVELAAALPCPTPALLAPAVATPRATAPVPARATGTALARATGTAPSTGRPGSRVPSCDYSLPRRDG